MPVIPPARLPPECHSAKFEDAPTSEE
ncbi:unnamed protein product [Ranitomeya imitator]|uniref:Uncharacterized protein n=1 Tax=Ranitomeya imitator TaxID=111125 RepID=A0ABN9LG70_9NEOB|nr:unnamed protein product [Ranitomeya imitator]